MGLGSGRRRGVVDSEAAGRNGVSAAALTTATPLAVGTCGIKWKCGRMNSCDEARYHLQECGLSRLDGDGDGVPYEKLCR